MINLPGNIFPASELQKMFWITNQITMENSAYNIASLFRINGVCDTGALFAGLSNVLNRHYVLKTGYRFENDELVQFIRSDIDFKPEISDLSALSGSDKEEQINSLLKSHVNERFDLQNALPVRVLFIKISDIEHILSIVFHHIVFDLESKYIFSDELSGYYQRYINNDDIVPAEAESQYTDFAVRQKNIIASNGYQEMISFWRKNLSSYSGYLNLPHDFQRPTVATGKGGQSFFNYNNRITSMLYESAKKHNVNIFIIMLSLYYLLLYRITSQNDIIIGVPLTNRRNASDKKTVGCFVNILPLPVTVTGKETFSDLVKQVRLAMLNAHRNQEVPFGIIVKEINPDRDSGYNPYFQAGFTFEQPMKLELHELDIKNIIPERDGAQLDIFMTMWESEDTVQGYLEYNSDIILPESASRIVDCYMKLSESVLENPGNEINSLKMLSSKEETKVINEWNDTGREYDLTKPLHRLFEIQADKTPDKTAVVFNHSPISYRELNERANRLARRLIEYGAGRDRLIGVFMERSIEMVISLYAILKSGAAYLPLSPELPDLRMKFMVEDAEPLLILTQIHLENRINDIGVPVLSIDAECTEFKGYPCTNPDVITGMDSVAYCIYTSGSTGRPKGVLVPHVGICNRLHWMQEYFKLTSDDRILQKTPFDFDVSVWEFFWPLLNGAALVVAEPGGHRDSQYLARIIKEEKITVIHFVPAMLDIFLRDPDSSGCPYLRYVICSGEALTYPLQERFFNTIDCGLYNLYGPTEASVDVTCWKCLPDYQKKIVPIGYPVANTMMYILNDALQPVPEGVSGNLYIGGIQLALGYLKRDELTKERFIPDPFTTGGRIYNTGDRARWLPDGAIEYLGRSDFQIKFNGLRIEAGEIESVIEEYPAVSQSVVSVSGVADKKILVAYYSLKKDSIMNLGVLRSHLREKIPASVVPSMFIELQSFPKTSSGKIDRKALPEPVLPKVSGTATAAVAGNRMEQTLLSVWSEFLKTQSIGLDDNFFDLGGHSLMLTLVNHKLREMFGINISIVDMFRYPTISSLARFIDNRDISEKSIDDVADRRKNRNEALQRFKKNRVMET